MHHRFAVCSITQYIFSLRRARLGKQFRYFDIANWIDVIANDVTYKPPSSGTNRATSVHLRFRSTHFAEDFDKIALYPNTRDLSTEYINVN